MLALDMVQKLTQGSAFSFRQMFSFANPASDNISLVYDKPDGTANLVAQAKMVFDSQSARMGYLLADAQDDLSLIATLFEALIKALGERGAIHLTTEVEVDSALVELLRRLDFNIWARERFWQLAVDQLKSQRSEYLWRQWQNSDVNAMRALYQNTVPGLFQAHEPLSRQVSLGMVLVGPDQKLMGYADLVPGPRGTWVQPVIRADVPDLGDVLLGLAAALKTNPRRPLVFCVRSYQPWLAQAFSGLDAIASGEYALMVKYMALKQKILNPQESHQRERNRGENGVPVTQIEKRQS